MGTIFIPSRRSKRSNAWHHFKHSMQHAV